ncbi:hypothetical protein [Flavobacterium enshiense]|uniref:Uncharacterized protein n=1 Tax=Flavobacterium enshiense DK69 TaxID=1107311 RepID=A0A0A2N5I8_9FLAO|nr:hypothetical protein [Flavobacterium enshiense]KGO95675.1 hypothetical protein Q767_10685 [Flavobacterium enshiense DK69]
MSKFPFPDFIITELVPNPGYIPSKKEYIRWVLNYIHLHVFPNITGIENSRELLDILKQLKSFVLYFESEQRYVNLLDMYRRLNLEDERELLVWLTEGEDLIKDELFFFIN